MIAVCGFFAVPAHPCSCGFLDGGFVAADGGRLPANAAGVVWWHDPDEVDSDENLAALFTVEIHEEDGWRLLTPKVSPVDEFSVERYRNAYIVSPAGERLEHGATYRFTFNPADREWQGKRRLAVTVDRETLSAQTALALDIGPTAVEIISVPNSVSCRSGLRASQVHVRAELPGHASQWQEHLLFRTVVDGNAGWYATEHLCGTAVPGRSSASAVGHDRVFAACRNQQFSAYYYGAGPFDYLYHENYIRLGLLKPGRHTVKMQAYLPGTGVVLETDVRAVHLVCQDEKTAQEEERSGPEVEQRPVTERSKDAMLKSLVAQMVVVPAGEYEMGSSGSIHEDPRHKVTIREPFAVGRYEVTRGQYAVFASLTGHEGGGCLTYEDDEFQESLTHSWRNPLYFDQADNHPVVCVSWADAKAFAGWLSEETGESYRLLAESEWEYAVRAGTTTRYHFGDDISPDQANYDREQRGTVPVGSYPANGFGLHDMHGNVDEWVEDCWHVNYEGAPKDGGAWTTGGDCGKRVLRGGSWYGNPGYLRSALRNWDTAGSRGISIGFRIARTLTP